MTTPDIAQSGNPSEKIGTLGINPALTADILGRFLQSELRRVGFRHAVFGLSGGIDSSVVAYLLCRALGIDRRLNGHDLISDDLFIARPPRAKPFEIVASPRIGVHYAGDWAERPLRFTIRDNAFVSRR